MKRNMISKGTRMTEEEYKNIKLMTDTALSMSIISKISNRSGSTISMIRTSKDYADYKRIVDTHIQKGYAKKKAKEAQIKSEVEKVTTPVEQPQALSEKVQVVQESKANDELITTLKNLTEAIITLSAVANKIGQEQASKSFFKR